MRYAIIDSSGVVLNLTLWDGDTAKWQPPKGTHGVLCDKATVSPGWQYADGRFVPPPPLPTTVPQTITNAQARAALRAAGLLDKVNSLVDSYDDPSAVDAWEYSAAFERDSPLLNGLGAMLGLTLEQIDGLFVEAAAIVF